MSQGDVRHRPGYLVKQLATAFRRASEERMRDLGLSMPQYAVLRALADVPGAPAAELARRTFVTRQSLRDVLAGLRSAGWVTVAERPTAGGKALPVTLTGSGREVLASGERIVLDVETRMLEGVDRERLGDLLAACARNLGAQ